MDANPARFERLADRVARMEGARVIGPEYARPKGNYSEPIRSWYERKRLGVEYAGDMGDAVFTPDLPETLCEAFEKLMPMYEYLSQVHRAAVREAACPSL